MPIPYMTEPVGQAPEDDGSTRPGRTHGSPTPVVSEELMAYMPYTPPSSEGLLDHHPWMRRIPLFGPLCESYGPKCIISLGVCHLLCKGIADQVMYGLMYAMFINRYNIGGDRYQRLMPLYTLAWAAKPFTAMFCDSFALFGYTKRWYMSFSCVLGAACAFIVALLPPVESSADIAGVLMFFSTFFKASVDILSEGFYSRLMRNDPMRGPLLVSWVWWFVLIGGMVASTMNGPLTDVRLPQVGIYISGALQLLTGIIFVFNFYGEKTNQTECAEDVKYMEDLRRAKLAGVSTTENLRSSTNEGTCMMVQQEHSVDKEGEETEALLLRKPASCLFGLFEFNKGIVVNKWRIFVYGFVMTVSVILLLYSNIFASKFSLLIACIGVTMVCCGMSFWALPLAIAKVNVFAYLQTATYIRLPGAVDTFYMADDKCVKDGPHFSYTFYHTVGTLVSSTGGLLGIIMFSYFFSKRTYRLAIILPTLAIAGTSFFDLMIMRRWNIKLGIPDHFLYLFGHGILAEILIKLQNMPMFVLLSWLCPRGSESLVYALMSGFFSLGQSTSTSFGSIVMEYIWPVRTKVPCDFNNTLPLILLCHVSSPMISLPFLFLLVPSARICDKMEPDGTVIRTKDEHDDATRTAPRAGGGESNKVELSSAQHNTEIRTSSI